MVLSHIHLVENCIYVQLVLLALGIEPNNSARTPKLQPMIKPARDVAYVPENTLITHGKRQVQTSALSIQLVN